mgnify:CR=1 FL=1
MDGYQIFTDATSDLAPELTAGLPSVEMIPMNVEIGGTEYTVTGSYEGTETLDKKLHRIMEQNAADDESDITEDGE